ncbi:MAG: YicC/YloC family endoribonuclease [Bacteroidia bacterium]
MIKSMTGFGKATKTIGNKTFAIELRSVNSKQLDLNLRMPSVYREKEIELRNFVAEKLIRGKIDLSLSVENNGEEKTFQINQELAKIYFNDLQQLAKNIGRENEPILPSLLRMPDIMKSEKTEIDEQEWKQILLLVDEAIIQFNQFRSSEGNTLEKDFTARVNTILSLLKSVEPFEQDRINTLKERIQKNLMELVAKENIDQNRFEQELIYYLEKFDITEEKVRLKTHCDYFLETIKKENEQGRKLNFISQEMGREINTLGSKANQSDMQKLVVQMKDELEKIKEQLLNVL